MLQSISKGPLPDGRGLPLLTGAILSTGLSILLWSALWAGWSMIP
jgi:hypothetical protein